MIDVILNMAKFAFSEDARKGVSAIIDLIRKSPEWQQDICLLQAKVEFINHEHAALLAGLSEEKLANLGYSKDAINAFRTSYLEMTTNAFEYGCGKSQAIEIAIEITKEYVGATVLNGPSHTFDLDAKIEGQRNHLRTTPNSRRGRGLLTVESLSDQITGLPPRGFKALFYRDRVRMVAFTAHGTHAEELLVIQVKSGIHNPSLGRRLFTACEHALRSSDVLLDLSEHLTRSTCVETVAIELGDIARSKGRKFAVLAAQPEFGHGMILPVSTLGQPFFNSWKETNEFFGWSVSQAVDIL